MNAFDRIRKQHGPNVRDREGGYFDGGEGRDVRHSGVAPRSPSTPPCARGARGFESDWGGTQDEFVDDELAARQTPEYIGRRGRSRRGDFEDARSGERPTLRGHLTVESEEWTILESLRAPRGTYIERELPYDLVLTPLDLTESEGEAAGSLVSPDVFGREDLVGGAVDRASSANGAVALSRIARRSIMVFAVLVALVACGAGTLLVRALLIDSPDTSTRFPNHLR